MCIEELAGLKQLKILDLRYNAKLGEATLVVLEAALSPEVECRITIKAQQG